MKKALVVIANLYIVISVVYHFFYFQYNHFINGIDPNNWQLFYFTWTLILSKYALKELLNNADNALEDKVEV